MFWMRACTLPGEVGGGWALEFPSFLGHFTHPKHYAQGCINHRCIGCFMHMSPLVTLTRCREAHTVLTEEKAPR
jgi:hypothetical protein